MKILRVVPEFFVIIILNWILCAECELEQRGLYPIILVNLSISGIFGT